MRKRFLRTIGAAALLLLSLPARAQFSSLGNDPGPVRWYQIQTSHYRLIYPRGLDSLSRIYASLLERYYGAEGASIGFLPGQHQWGKTPVILHAYTGTSNGAVTWAPKRLDLFTLPEPYDSDPLPWEHQLAVHESRHLAQMQFGYRRLFKPLNYLIGEMWPGALSAIFPNQALLEGDAVVAETALTDAGRSRTADFLNYFHVAFDCGDYRNWYRWRYGSYRHFTPDYYKAGYLTVAGIRYFYDDPLFMQEYFDHILRHPFSIGNLQKTAKKASGANFKSTFNRIMHGFHEIWQKEAEARRPYMPMEQVTFPQKFYTDYTNSTAAEGVHYVFKSGLTHSKTLTILGNDGKEKTVGAFAKNTCSAIFDPCMRRFYWSETVPDPRWSLKQTSRIRYMSLADFKKHDLTRKGRLYNPIPFPDGERLVAAEYPIEGGSAIVVLSSRDGSLLQRYPAPKGIQVIEPMEHNGDIYMIALVEGGYCLYRVDKWGAWHPLTAPARQKLQCIDLQEEADGEVYLKFISDRDGKNELYHYCIGSGKLFQITSTRYGAVGYCTLGDYLYYSSQTPDGMMVFRTRLSDLRPREVQFSDVHQYVVEDALSEQEKALGATVPAEYSGAVSGPKRYRKLSHLVHFHSWTPFYFNPDEIESFSLDYSYDQITLGATGLFQNLLGTASGFVGYSARKDPGDAGKWRHSAHMKFLYTGLYPVVSVTADFNDRNNVQYNSRQVTAAGLTRQVNYARLMKTPCIYGSLRTYIPLSFSKGGWSIGVVPLISYSISNDWFNTASVRLTYQGSAEGMYVPRFLGVSGGQNVPLQSLSASIRGYVMRPAAASQVYPSLGIGAEAGYSGRPFMQHLFTPSVYAYLYGYLPGIVRQQGFRFTALAQRQFGSGFGEHHVSFSPRGFDGAIDTFIARQFDRQLKLTAEYAIPIYTGDISFLSPVVYIKNFLLAPHFDCTAFEGGNLYSTGASFSLEMANLLWLPFDCSWGIDYSCNGGSYFSTLRQNNLPLDRHSIRFVFSMDI